MTVTTKPYLRRNTFQILLKIIYKRISHLCEIRTPVLEKSIFRYERVWEYGYNGLTILGYQVLVLRCLNMNWSSSLFHSKKVNNIIVEGWFRLQRYSISLLADTDRPVRGLEACWKGKSKIILRKNSSKSKTRLTLKQDTYTSTRWWW